MPSGCRQALKPLSKVLLQQRRTGLCKSALRISYRVARSSSSQSFLLCRDCSGTTTSPRGNRQLVHPASYRRSPGVGAVSSFSCTGPFWDMAFNLNLSLVALASSLVYNWISWKGWPEVPCWFSARRVITGTDIEWILSDTNSYNTVKCFGKQIL